MVCLAPARQYLTAVGSSTERSLVGAITLKTFKCNFGDGISCEVRISDQPPSKGTLNIEVHEWTGTPTRRVLRPYIAWMNTVIKSLADEWNMKLMYVYMVSPTKNECWLFEPGKPPKRDRNL